MKKPIEAENGSVIDNELRREDKENEYVDSNKGGGVAGIEER